MKPSPVLAVILAASLPGGAFAQNFSAAARAGAASEAGSAASAVVIPAISPVGALSALSLSAPSMAPGLLPAAGVEIQAFAAPAALQPAALTPAASAPSRAETVKPATALPAAAKPVASKPGAALKSLLPAASKDDGRIGEAAPADSDPGAALFDGALKAVIVRHGQASIVTTPENLSSVLAAADIRKASVRLLTAKKDPRGVTEKDAPRVGELLRAGGMTAKIQQEALAVDWNAAPSASEAAAPETKASFSLKSALLWPVREARFLGKSFKASLVKPEASEVVGGVVTKSFPLVTAIGVYWATAGLAHPFVFAGLIGLSLAQEIFHGIYLKSWNNFQEILFKTRGFNYQVFFNFAYVQTMGTLYRLLSWVANPASVTPPWSVKYWQDMAVMSVVGTFFGVLGYNALNELYNKGVIKRWQHSGIQQLRDLCMLLSAPFFASGSMTVFWTIFVIQQLFDLAIAIWAGRAKARPVVFIVSDAVAASPEFQKKYPAEGAKIEPPLKSALKAVVDNPFIRLISWPLRAVWKRVRGGAK